MEKVTLFLSAVLSGLSSPAQLFHAPTYKRSPGTDLERMRGDWERVGNTMKSVIDREWNGVTAKEKQASGDRPAT